MKQFAKKVGKNKYKKVWRFDTEDWQFALLLTILLFILVSVGLYNGAL